MALPFIALTGDPYAQGRAHGEALAERVAANRAIYFERFARETLLAEDEVHAIAARWSDWIASRHRDYQDALRGVADGSGLPLLDIVALNVRYEILYYQFGKLATARAESQGDGCTSYAILPSATDNGHLVMGQNWDWIPEVQGAVVKTTDPDGFQTLGFTEAGIVGTKIGLNTAGIGLALNGMTSTADDWARPVTPYHLRFYRILRSRTLDQAIQVITDEPRGCSANLLLAQAPDRVVDLEVAPDVVNRLAPERGVLTHANHFVAPDSLGIVEPPNDRRVYSRRRQARLRALLEARGTITIAGLEEDLRDTRDDPFGVCRHRNLAEPPELHYVTVTAAILDLDDRTVRFTDGPPDQNPFQTFGL